MKALGYTCAAGICFALLWPVLAALEINPWWSSFFGLAVAGPLFAMCALFELLAKRAGALDVKSRAEQRLSPEQAAEGIRAILGPKSEGKAAPD